jgi:hypothetical protein
MRRLSRGIVPLTFNQPGSINNTERFITNNAGFAGDGLAGHYGQLIWNPDQNILSALFRIDATCCDAIYNPPPSVSFVLAPDGSIGVPENATIVFLAIDLLCLAVYWSIVGYPKPGG